MTEKQEAVISRGKAEIEKAKRTMWMHRVLTSKAKLLKVTMIRRIMRLLREGKIDKKAFKAALKQIKK